MKTDRKWLAIGQIAKRAGVNASALRFYEQKGLISSVRSDGSQRLYPQDVLRRIAFIRVAQGMGLSLGEIADALAGLPDGRTPDRNDDAQPTRGSKMLNITRDTGELLAGCKGEWLVVSLSGE